MRSVGGPPRIRLSQSHLPEIALRGVPVPLYDRAGLSRRIVHVGVGHAPSPRDEAAVELIASPTTSILSLTITEAGYAEPAPDQPGAGGQATFDRIAAALAHRRERSAGPLTILSFDNMPGNGAA